MSSESSSSKKVSTPGTTATVVFIRDNYELVVGHIGDSKWESTSASVNNAKAVTL